MLKTEAIIAVKIAVKLAPEGMFALVKERIFFIKNYYSKAIKKTVQKFTKKCPFDLDLKHP